ncbi:MAG: tetratricopeptide repeat protein [Candidatus Riflebacteria bacterium]|nr:tetratricopeptide repeat protein [Candidatus Riflebacteria bacterium]
MASSSVILTALDTLSNAYNSLTRQLASGSPTLFPICELILLGCIAGIGLIALLPRRVTAARKEQLVHSCFIFLTMDLMYLAYCGTGSLWAGVLALVLCSSVWQFTAAVGYQEFKLQQLLFFGPTVVVLGSAACFVHWWWSTFWITTLGSMIFLGIFAAVTEGLRGRLCPYPVAVAQVRALAAQLGRLEHANSSEVATVRPQLAAARSRMEQCLLSISAAELARADRFLAAGKEAAATELLEESLQRLNALEVQQCGAKRNAALSQVHLRLGKLRFKSGSLDRAENHFYQAQRGLDLRSTPEAVACLASSAARKKLTSTEALEFYMWFVKLRGPADPGAETATVYQMLRSWCSATGASSANAAGQASLQRKRLQELLTWRAEVDWALLELAKLDEREGRWQTAQETYQRATRLRTVAVEAHLGLARIHLACHRPGDSVRTCQEILRLQPALAAARDLLGQAMVEDLLGRNEDFPEGVSAADRANLAQALEVLRPLAGGPGATARLCLGLGLCLRVLEGVGPALGPLERAAELDPRDAVALYHLADCLGRLETPDLGKVAARLERVLELDPRHVRARVKLARLRFDAGRQEMAAELLTGVPEASAATTGQPARAGWPTEARLLRAELAYARERYAEVGQLLGPLEGLSVRHRFLRARARARSREFEAAVRDYEAVLAVEPKHREANYYLACAMAHLGRNERLPTLLKAHLQSNATDHRPFLLLGNVYLHHGQTQLAVDMLKQGLARAPGDPDLLCAAAAVYMRSGALKQAESMLKQVTQTHSRHGVAFAMLGKTFEGSGRVTDAIGAYERALDSKLD